MIKTVVRMMWKRKLLIAVGVVMLFFLLDMFALDRRQSGGGECIVQQFVQTTLKASPPLKDIL